MSTNKTSFGVLIVSQTNGHRILSCSGPLTSYSHYLLGAPITRFLRDFNPGTIKYMRDDRILERSFYMQLPGGQMVEIAGCIAVEPEGAGSPPTYTIVLDLADADLHKPEETQTVCRPPIPGFF